MNYIHGRNFMPTYFGNILLQKNQDVYRYFVSRKQCARRVVSMQNAIRNMLQVHSQYRIVATLITYSPL